MNKLLLICNEAKSVINNKKYDPDMLKKMITEDSIDMHKKFHDVFTQQKVANFIFLSNNFAPLKIEEGDRRFIIMETLSEKREDREYFSNPYKSFSPDFYLNLLSFFGFPDIAHLDPNVIALKNEKIEIINFLETLISFSFREIMINLKGFLTENCL